MPLYSLHGKCHHCGWIHWMDCFLCISRRVFCSIISPRLTLNIMSAEFITIYYDHMRKWCFSSSQAFGSSLRMRNKLLHSQNCNDPNIMLKFYCIILDGMLIWMMGTHYVLCQQETLSSIYGFEPCSECHFGLNARMMIIIQDSAT